MIDRWPLIVPPIGSRAPNSATGGTIEIPLISSLADGMGSSESDGAQQQQSMFKVKGLTLIKEAVNGLVKSSPRKEPTDFPETTLISLPSLKSRVVAALTAQGGSPVSEANSCSRSLRSRPSASQATDSCAAQGPKCSATAMTAYSEPPLLLKKPKLERATDPPETKLISLPSLKSRVVAALTAQGGSPVSGANSCSRSLRSRPSASQATDSCAAQGPKRSATAMTAHSEPPLLLKKPKLERAMDSPETKLISLPSLKSRVVAALTAQGGSPVSGANSCSRSLLSQPSTSQATDSCAAQGPKRSATAMTAHSEPPLLLKKPKLERATDSPETKLISLTSLKSRVVAALTAQGGSHVSGANSCSRSLFLRPSTSQATDACAAQGPKRSATAMTAHSEPPLLLKLPKLEREQSPDPQPAESSPSCPEQTAGGKQSLRSRKRYVGAGVSSMSSPHANAASSTYESPATPVYMKMEPLEELPQPQEASLPSHSAEVSPPSSMPKSLPGTSPVKVESADAPSGLWDIPPKLWEDMQSVLFTHLDST